jgi:DNA-binding protein YbaB
MAHDNEGAFPMTQMNSDSVRELRREADALRASFDVPPDKLTGCTGTDKTSSVTVALNARGLVTKVIVAGSWRDTMRPHQLGRAVLDAIDAGGQRLLSAWASAVAENDGNRHVEAVAEPAVAVPAPSDEARAATVQELFGLIEKLDNEFAGRTAGVVTVATAKTVGRSGGRHVAVTLTGKQISTVDINEEWLAVANHQDIANEVLAAIRAAYETARRTASEILANSAATQLQALTRDPAALLRRLGMS